MFEQPQKLMEVIHEKQDGDIRYQMCRCSRCGVVARCTPDNDFYGEPGEPLECEACVLDGMDVQRPMIHMVPVIDCSTKPPKRTYQQVTKSVSEVTLTFDAKEE